jgi:hypothetical protein
VCEVFLEALVGGLGRDLLDAAKHLIVGRPQVLEFVDVEVFEVFGRGHVIP